MGFLSLRNMSLKEHVSRPHKDSIRKSKTFGFETACRIDKGKPLQIPNIRVIGSSSLDVASYARADHRRGWRSSGDRDVGARRSRCRFSPPLGLRSTPTAAGPLLLGLPYSDDGSWTPLKDVTIGGPDYPRGSRPKNASAPSRSCACRGVRRKPVRILLSARPWHGGTHRLGLVVFLNRP